MLLTQIHLLRRRHCVLAVFSHGYINWLLPIQLRPSSVPMFRLSGFISCNTGLRRHHASFCGTSGPAGVSERARALNCVEMTLPSSCCEASDGEQLGSDQGRYEAALKAREIVARYAVAAKDEASTPSTTCKPEPSMRDQTMTDELDFCNVVRHCRSFAHQCHRYSEG